MPDDHDRNLIDTIYGGIAGLIIVGLIIVGFIIVGETDPILGGEMDFIFGGIALCFIVCVIISIIKRSPDN